MLGWMLTTEQAIAEAVRDRRRWHLAVGSLVALGLAVALVAAAIDISPLCVLYNEGDIMWWLLGCWGSGPPPPWPWP